jgi:hypothetical protein
MDEPKDRLIQVPLTNSEKTCVVIGAAHYAALADRIDLSRNETFAHYGVIRRDLSFTAIYEPLIEAGARFDQRGTISREIVNGEFGQQNGDIRIYQIMSSDPASVIGKADQKHRYSVLCRLNVPGATGVRVDSLALTLHSDDRFNALAVCNGAQTPADGTINITDILEDQDESARWLITPL